MALTTEGKQEVQSMVDASITQLKAESQTVEGLSTVDDLSNVVSLPALQGSSVVKVPLSLLKGEKGDTGAKGESGTDAYAVAKQNGFTGTYAEWRALVKEIVNSGDTIDAAATGIGMKLKRNKLIYTI